ncbi:MAG: DUF2589 domain-containing protein [Treponema sp.]|jgi:hypothetical protein|nr:DUF2589 domain-containing protein [Treponema sp.]
MADLTPIQGAKEEAPKKQAGVLADSVIGAASDIIQNADPQNGQGPMQPVQRGGGAGGGDGSRGVQVGGGEGGGGGTAESFVGLPIESLICGPILAAARGQQALTDVYIDGILNLAYEERPEKGKSAPKTRILEFQYQRPVTAQDKAPEYQDASIKAPLLSLVPVPAFTMDELTVDFEMEVKASDMQTDTDHKDAGGEVNYHSMFGLSAKITGKVSSDSTHTRNTDSSAKYKIHARAIQQPPSEGMAKLTSLFAQAMEPINVSK